MFEAPLFRKKQLRIFRNICPCFHITIVSNNYMRGQSFWIFLARKYWQDKLLIGDAHPTFNKKSRLLGIQIPAKPGWWPLPTIQHEPMGADRPKKLSFCYLNTKWLQVAQFLLLVSSVQQQRPHTAPPEPLGRTSGFDLGGRKVVGGCQDVWWWRSIITPKCIDIESIEVKKECLDHFQWFRISSTNWKKYPSILVTGTQFTAWKSPTIQH